MSVLHYLMGIKALLILAAWAIGGLDYGRCARLLRPRGGRSGGRLSVAGVVERRTRDVRLVVSDPLK